MTKVNRLTEAFDKWNPRFVAYAQAHGRTPEAQLEADRERWPGGIMAGFIVWTRQRWQVWAEEIGRRDLEVLTQEEHDAFTAWVLATSTPEARP